MVQPVKIELCDHEGTALWVYDDPYLEVRDGEAVELRLPDEIEPLLAATRVLRVFPAGATRPIRRDETPLSAEDRHSG